MTDSWLSEEATTYLSQTAVQRQRLGRRNLYYHRESVSFFRSAAEAGSRILIVGCRLGELLHHLEGKQICAVDLDLTSPGVSTSPTKVVCETLEQARKFGPYDYVFLPFTFDYIDNIQAFLNALAPLLDPRTRVVVLQNNFLWVPLVRIAQKISLRAPFPELNWLNLSDLRNLLVLTGYQEITTGGRCLIPFQVPLVTGFINRYVAPLIPWLCQKSYLIVRFQPPQEEAPSRTVSIVVPARNEAGNIAPLLDLLPNFGETQEVLFVEGHSRDDTWGEIQRQIAGHPRRNNFTIRAFQQSGEGKADAVRLGFSKATGDILMILDADLSVPPDELILFYEGITCGRAEFLNGSRLVYRMERHAMQLLNLMFNKLFGIWIGWLIGQPVKDTLCGTKVLFRQDYIRLLAKISDWGFNDPFGDFELLFGASQLHLKICDVPVRYRERRYGQTNIRRFKNGWQLMRFCFAAWRMRL